MIYHDFGPTPTTLGIILAGYPASSISNRACYYSPITGCKEHFTKSFRVFTTSTPSKFSGLNSILCCCPFLANSFALRPSETNPFTTHCHSCLAPILNLASCVDYNNSAICPAFFLSFLHPYLSHDPPSILSSILHLILPLIYKYIYSLSGRNVYLRFKGGHQEPHVQS